METSGAGESAAAQPVLLYDGECGLCQACVRFLLRRDAGGRLRFAALQAPAAQAWLRARGLPAEDFSSLVFVPDWARRGAGPYLLRTEAVAAALAAAGLRRRAAGLRAVPRPVRDAGYRLVARLRRTVFGAGRPGALDRPEWRGRFVA